jgi:hypothetical protein
MIRISEPDWRALSKLKPVALARLCERILTEVTAVATDKTLSAHERYLKVFAIIDEQDKQIAYIFNGLTRSNGLSRLSRMREEDLITEAEMAVFSSEAREHAADVF